MNIAEHTKANEGSGVTFGGVPSVLARPSKIPASTAQDRDIPPSITFESDAYDILNVTRSSRMKDVLRRISIVGTRPEPCLIIGERGTTKESAAKAIHAVARNGLAFLPVTCSGIPSTLLQSTLFGHKKGSFSGALTDKRGLLEKIGSGDIFLDEIDKTDHAFQTCLLRVLESGDILPVGGGTTRRFHGRVIAAGSQVMSKVRSGEFMDELFDRFEWFTITLPPLRERKEDIPLLVTFLMRKNQMKKPIADDALELLSGYDWPGNIRELRNVLGRISVLVDSDAISADALRSEFASKFSRSKSYARPTDIGLPRTQLYSNAIGQAYQQTGHKYGTILRAYEMLLPTIKPPTYKRFCHELRTMCIHFPWSDVPASSPTSH